MNCIFQRNPYCGFESKHSIFCLYCEENATVHFNTGFCCGNVCEKCAKKRFRPAEIESGIYVEVNDAGQTTAVEGN